MRGFWLRPRCGLSLTVLGLYTALFGSCYRRFGRVCLRGYEFSYELSIYSTPGSSLWQIP
jgi:hypothetical protein